MKSIEGTQKALVALEIETQTYNFHGLVSGAGATDVAGATGEGAGVLAGAGDTALSSSSVICTLQSWERVSTLMNACGGLGVCTHRNRRTDSHTRLTGLCLRGT